MLSWRSFLVLSITCVVAPAWGGDDAIKARLKNLQERVARKEFDNDNLRRDLLAFARMHVGTPLHTAAMVTLRNVPSPLDKLDENSIDAEVRKTLSVSRLVAYLRPHGRAVAHVAISCDGDFLATSGWDNVLHIHKLGAKEPKSWAKLDGSPSGLAFRPDGKMLFAGCRDTRVLGWELTGAEPKEKDALSGHKSRPFAVAITPKGNMLASGSSQPILRISNLNEREPESWVDLDRDKFPAVGISSLAFSHDGKYLVAGHLIGKDSLRIWDVSGEFLDDKHIPGATARLIACSPTAPIVAFADDDGAIHVWNFGGKMVDKLHKLAGHAKKDLTPPVKALAFSADGKLLASAGQDKRLCIWDVSKGDKVHEWHLLDEPRAAAFASDSRHLAVGNNDGTLYVLRLQALAGSSREP
jgi:WD40 repeat protein